MWAGQHLVRGSARMRALGEDLVRVGVAVTGAVGQSSALGGRW